MIHHRPRRSLCAAEAPTPCPRRWTSKVPKFARESWRHWAARHAIPGSSHRRNSRPVHLPLEQPAPLDNQSVSSVFISFEQAIYASRARATERSSLHRFMLPAPCSLLFIAFPLKISAPKLPSSAAMLPVVSSLQSESAPV